ncbi:MAG: hypothetical protein WDW38_001501 [Sanguina aurantia]
MAGKELCRSMDDLSVQSLPLLSHTVAAGVHSHPVALAQITKTPLAHDPGCDNLGTHLANRLVQNGCGHAFGVPGDFNLLLLDQLEKVPELNMVWCCNELNAGYAADGYARGKGIGCVVVTFCVGGFSVFNAVAGAYAEDLPVVVVSGGPNTNDFASNHTLHHTTGDADVGQQMRAFAQITCCQVLIRHLEDAHRQIDFAISECLAKRKPVYIEVCCNLADQTHPSFVTEPIPYSIANRHTNLNSLEAAVSAAVAVLDKAVKPVLLAGVRIRPQHCRDAFMALAESSHYPVAILPDAKGFFPEHHKRYIGRYWGAVSSPSACEVVESSDVIVTAGAVWTDYTTVGYSLLLKPSKMIAVEPNRVTVCGGQTFGCIQMDDFLNALAAKLKPNDNGFVAYQRMHVASNFPDKQPDDEPLRINVMFKHIQAYLRPEHALLTEVGDSWFNTQKLHLPDGCSYEMQMRYGSIGWSVGAALGQYFATIERQKRVLAFIGDGSFQMSAQEVSTMLRYGSNAVIFLINNGAYTIEVEIHDGPYNVIKNWNYTACIEGFCNGEGKLWTCKVRTEPQLQAALAEIDSRPQDLCFIEVFTHRDDCSKELLEWGSRVAVANSRKHVANTP